jgi:hypothetical protein
MSLWPGIMFQNNFNVQSHNVSFIRWDFAIVKLVESFEKIQKFTQLQWQMAHVSPTHTPS